MSEGLKKCPFCAEEIKIDALLCKHCNKSLNPKDQIKKEIIKRGAFQGTPNIRCPRCEFEGKAKLHKNYSMTTAVLLFICFIIPWLIYEMTRTTKYVCPQCENDLLQKI